jgi:hypothetical protein
MGTRSFLPKAIMTGLVPILSLLLVPPASAGGDRSGLEQRAKCAAVGLAKAMGERVSVMDKKACSSAGQMKTPKDKPKPFAGVTLKVESPAANSRPSWINSIPTQHGVYYGVGEGPTTMAALREALTQVAAQVQIEIRSEMVRKTDTSAVDSVHSDGSESSRSNVKEDVSSFSESIVRGSLKEVKMAGRWVDPSGKHYVLAALDQSAIEERDEELVQAVFETLSEVTERFVLRQADERVLSQDNLRELTLALSEVNALGKTKMGKKQKKKWKPAYRNLQKLVKKMVNCVTVKGNYVLSNGKKVPIKSSPTLTQGSKIQLELSCAGMPIADATMKTYPSGGLVQIPMSFQTDSEGKAEVNVGSVLGAGVKLGFTHDLLDVPGAFWLSSVKPNRKSEITFRAGAPATIRFDVKGGRGSENETVAAELGSFAQRQWGATTVKSNAVLVGKARLRFPPPTKVGAKFAAPIEVDVALTLAGEGGTLIDTTVRTGGVGSSASEARTKAMSTLGQQIARLRVKPVMDMSVQVVMQCRMAGVNPSKPATIQAAVGKCLKFLSGYRKADKDAILSNSLTKIQAQLGSLSSPPGVPSDDVTDVPTLKRGVKTLKKAHKACKKLIGKARLPELRTAVEEACRANVQHRVSLTAAISAIEEAAAAAAAAARREAAAEKAEAKRQAAVAKAQGKRQLNCEVRCKKAAIGRTSNPDWKMMRITYQECMNSGNETGCVREAVQFCVRACLR